MNEIRPDRMSGTRMDRRHSRWARFCRWISGDWWEIESKDGRYGVWHPWRLHVWENYRFSLEEARAEQRRRNDGHEYEICPDCECTYASHQDRRLGGIKCPSITPSVS